MRSWDLWNRYLDNQNHPLHGCVAFMVRDGNTPAPIYDQDGTPLDNPQITDIYGRTEHQVFIEEDVTAYFYKYIGQGSLEEEEELGIDTSDVTKWALQYTSENQSSNDIHLTSDSAMCISTIADLRALNPADVPEIDGKKVITLLGYYNAGDKEPINYVWDRTQTHADTGGSYIKCNDLITGRWEMVQPTEHCDSRHFGAFPSNSSNMADQTYQIGQLFAYCSVHALRPFFNGSTDYRWFKYTNLNVICEAIDVTEETRFYDAGQDNTIQGEWNGNPHFTQNNTNVKARKVKTSWGAKSYINYEDVVIDANTTQKNWQDAHIDVRVNPLFGYNFTHCSFEENGNIGSDNTNNINNTFNNCKLNERMFILDGDYQVSLAGLCTNCQLDMDDFRNSMWLYKQIRQTMDGDAFFDFRNFPNVGKPIHNWVANKITSDAVWFTNMKNLMTDRYVLDNLGGQVTTFYLENCIGYYQTPANCTVVLINSTVKLRPNANLNLNIQGGAVEFDDQWNDSWTLGSVALKDTTLNAGDITYKVTALGSRDSTVNALLDVTGNGAYYNTAITKDQYVAYADVKDCNIGAQFYLYGITGDDISFPIYDDAGQQTATLHTTRYMNGTFKDNYVSGQIILGVPAGNAHYAANWLARGLSITNNTGLAAHPIAINRGQSTHYEQYNIYEYKGNKGSFPGHYSFQIPDISVGLPWYTSGTNGCLFLGFQGSVDGWPTHYEGETGKTDPNTYMTEIEMFTVGTIGVRMKMTTYPPATRINANAIPRKDKMDVLGTIRVLDTVERTYAEYSADAQTFTPWAKDLYWMNDMTWRITNWAGFLTISAGNPFTDFQNAAPMEFDVEPALPWPLLN